LRVGF
jgi:hypothetical protein